MTRIRLMLFPLFPQRLCPIEFAQEEKRNREDDGSDEE